MADKKPLDATFFAFQKRDKMVLLPATLTLAVIFIVFTGVFLFLSRGAIVDYFQWATSLGQMAAAGKTASMFPPSSVMNLIPGWFLLQVVSYIAFASWEAGCLKWMIRGDSSGFFGLTLGGDTWRVYLTYWLWLAVLLVLYFACAIAGFAAGAGLFGAAMQNTSQAPAGVFATLGFIAVILALIAGFIFVAVRLAPAAAASVAQKRFAFFSAWSITRDRFWSMFGAFAILYLTFFVGYIIVSMVLGVMMGVAMATSMMGAGGGPPDPTQMFALMASPNFLVPLLLFYLVVGSAVFAFLIAMLGVNARAVLAAADDGKIQIPGVGPAEHFT